MTSQSSVGTTRITLQFGLNRDIDGAARDVQAAINAARADLPASPEKQPDVPQGQSRRRADPDSRALVEDAHRRLSSTTPPRPCCSRRSRRCDGRRRSRRERLGESGRARRTGTECAVSLRHRPRRRARGARRRRTRTARKARSSSGRTASRSTRTTRRARPTQYRDLVVAYRNGAAVQLSDVAEVVDSVEDLRNLGLINDKRAVLVILYRQPGANIIETIDRVKAMLPQLQAVAARRRRDHADRRPFHHDPRVAARHRAHADDRGGAGRDGRVPVPAQLARDADSERRRADLDHRHVRARCTCSASRSTTSR